MNRSRTALAGGAAVLAIGAAVASGAIAGGSDAPPAESLPQAIHDALVAPPVKGITARITFTNKVIDSSSLTGGGPLLTGAKGRVWIADDGHARLELQSDRGDAQITTDGKTVTVYDASTDTAYKADLPAGPTDAQIAKAKADHPESTTPPSVAKISDVIAKLEQSADVIGPEGTNVAGRPAYSVKLAPHHGGLVGAAEVAWDAATGTALRAGIYATGSTKPVLELAATDISYGAVDASAFDVAVPAGAKVQTVDLTRGSGDPGAAGQRGDDHIGSLDRAGNAKRAAAVTGVDAVGKALPFTLSAPATLAGQDRTAVRLVGKTEGKQGALVTYGTGLGGIAVLETPVDPSKPAATTPAAPKSRHGGDGKAELSAPTVDVNGAKASEIATALGTVIRFERAGVQYTVIGSISAADAVAAARGL